MRRIKTAFDPRNVFNPGKIIDPPAERLRNRGLPDGPACGRCGLHVDTELAIASACPSSRVLAFAAKDGSFVRNLEQCNGCGGCRKETPTMCPTFMATGEEIMSTRGRANAIRAVLEGRGARRRRPAALAELEAALSNCLSCKACTTECPSNVNLALLKAELLHARTGGTGCRCGAAVQRRGSAGPAGVRVPGLANAALRMRAACAGCWNDRSAFARNVPCRRYATERFDRWFARRPVPRGRPRGRVILGTTPSCATTSRTSATRPWPCSKPPATKSACRTGASAAAGPRSARETWRRRGGWGRHNLDLLRAPPDAGLPMIFLEPSCWSMFSEDYRELNLPGADEVAQALLSCSSNSSRICCSANRTRCGSSRGRAAWPSTRIATRKRCVKPAFMPAGARLPGRQVALLETGCCGMAGAFGTMASNYELSLKVGSRCWTRSAAAPGPRSWPPAPVAATRSAT